MFCSVSSRGVKITDVLLGRSYNYYILLLFLLLLLLLLLLILLLL